MKRYEEIKDDKVIRVVTLSELQAKRLNGKSKQTGFKYVEEKEKKLTGSDEISKEEREDLKKRAEELNLEYAKNIKSTDLKQLVEKAESKLNS